MRDKEEWVTMAQRHVFFLLVVDSRATDRTGEGYGRARMHPCRTATPYR